MAAKSESDDPVSTLSEKQLIDALGKVLTQNEKLYFAEALKYLKKLVLLQTLKSLSKWLAGIATVLAIVGITSLLGVKDSLISVGASKLVADEALQKKIETSVTTSIETSKLQLERIKEIELAASAIARAMQDHEIFLEKKKLGLTATVDEFHERVTKEEARAATAIRMELRELNQMLAKIKTEVERLQAPAKVR